MFWPLVNSNFSRLATATPTGFPHLQRTTHHHGDSQVKHWDTCMSLCLYRPLYRSMKDMADTTPQYCIGTEHNLPDLMWQKTIQLYHLILYNLTDVYFCILEKHRISPSKRPLISKSLSLFLQIIIRCNKEAFQASEPEGFCLFLLSSFVIAVVAVKQTFQVSNSRGLPTSVGPLITTPANITAVFVIPY